MSLLLPMLSCVLSFVSTCVMSYLALGIEITFWVAPILSLIVVLTLLHFRDGKLAQEWAVMLLAAGSVGGMIGMSVGFSWPTLYFLHKKIFLAWMHSPIMFATMIALLVIAAGCLAIAIVTITRPYFVHERAMRFPTAQVVYSMMYHDAQSHKFMMMLKGVLASFAWSGTALLMRARLYGFWLVQVHTVPTLLGMGFVAGSLVTKPLLIGMIVRQLVLYGVKGVLFTGIVDEDFILIFCLGMLLALIVLSLATLGKHLYNFLPNLFSLAQSAKAEKRGGGEVSPVWFIVQSFTHKISLVLCVIAAVICYVVLHSWQITIWQQLYVVFAVSIACMIVAAIFGEVGVLDLPNFGSFIAVPFGYLFYVTAESNLIVFIFATICMGLVVNILFSWKLADLAKVSFQRLLRYQAIGFVVAVLTIGLVIWWYAESLRLGANPLFSEQALLQEKFITITTYDHNIFWLGFACAALMYFFVADISIVIAGCMMQFSVVSWVVLAGIVAHFVKDRERYYPFCFGLYASHALWLFVQAVLL